jgi:hypothetical protein
MIDLVLQGQPVIMGGGKRGVGGLDNWEGRGREGCEEGRKKKKVFFGHVDFFAN